MLREKIIYKDKSGNEKLLAYYLRGENDEPVRVDVVVGAKFGFGGKRVSLNPGESVRFESAKDE